MTIYKYIGRTAKGILKKGTVDAVSERHAILKLRDQGINPREVTESQSILHKEISIGSPVKQQDFVMYCRQFSTLIQAGISIVEATSILANQTESQGLRQALEKVMEDIKEGNSFSATIAQQPKVFPVLFSNMIKAGEATGNLDETLERLAMYFEKQYTIKKKIQSVLAYPIIILAITMVVVIFMMTVILPRFTAMFEQLGAELPSLTVVILSLGNVIQGYWWLLLIILVAVVISFRVLHQKSHIFRDAVATVLLKTPVFGKVLQKVLIARMTRTLSSLFSSSVPILQALVIVEKVVDHPLMGKVLQKAKTSLESGNRLSEPFEESWLFPPLVAQMTAIGEKTGSLDSMLANIADFYEAEVDRTVDTLKSLIEPLMIVFLAVVVGTIVLAVMMPLLSIYTQI
ncbi:type II secretion system F family protein [Jeotgalibacillus soli]|uniref:Type II secretory pathway, component PulF n=1 Tax=Jeotgalibacillus soli TaxID=889306 RepID=A0A0C2VJA9_9BACL|nr:type II secretion system F family protein [Jeotgalibacillus soli]KIL44566.1 type II secretory pathway, component PulF [Jeotgalibacillus soli]